MYAIRSYYVSTTGYFLNGQWMEFDDLSGGAGHYRVITSYSIHYTKLYDLPLDLHAHDYRIIYLTDDYSVTVIGRNKRGVFN